MQLLILNSTNRIVINLIFNGFTQGSFSFFLFLYIFCRASVCWPFLCLCRPVCIFEICLDTNPESCRSKQRCATNLATPSPLYYKLHKHWKRFYHILPNWNLFLSWMLWQSTKSRSKKRTVETTGCLLGNPLFCSLRRWSPVMSEGTEGYVSEKLNSWT
jgi:hypothetical protein